MRLLFVLFVACASAPPKQARPVAAAPVPTVGHAKTFEKNGDGGIIELVGEREAALDHAESLMAQHCGAESFTVIADGPEAFDGSGDPCALQIAFRVHYRCGSRPFTPESPLEVQLP